jgi:hypothetical protein
MFRAAWGSIVVKALRYTSEGPGIDSGVAGVFSVASDSSICPGVDSPSKNEYQVNPGGKDGRCVRLTTYHLHVPMSRNLGALTSWNPVGLFRPVMGQIFTCFEQPRARHQENQLYQYIWYMSLCVGDRFVCRSERNFQTCTLKCTEKIISKQFQNGVRSTV